MYTREIEGAEYELTPVFKFFRIQVHTDEYVRGGKVRMQRPKKVMHQLVKNLQTDEWSWQRIEAVDGDPPKLHGMPE